MMTLEAILRAGDRVELKAFLRDAKTQDLPLIYVKCAASRIQDFAALTLAEMNRR